MSSYPLTRLVDVVTEVSRRAKVVDDVEYDLLGAHWYAKGLYVKDRKNGKSIKANYLYKVKEGDFVYNRLFGWKGAFAVVSSKQEGCYVSGEFPCFETNSEKLLTRYLWYYFSLEAVWEVIDAMSSGSTPTSRKRFRQDEFLKREIPLPPLSVQKKIVAVLDMISEIIANTEGSINHISSIKQGLMQHLLTQGVGHTKFKTTKIGEIPEIWKLEVLANLVAITDCEHKTAPESKGPTEWVSIRSSEIGMGSLDLCECKYISKKSYDEWTKRRTPKPGDIIFTREAPFGHVARVPETPRIALGQRMVLLSVENSVSSDYLMFALLYPTMQRYIERRSVGTTAKRIDVAEIEKLPIVIPPQQEQDRIAGVLDKLTKIINVEKEVKNCTEILKKGLMQVLLTGKERMKV